MSPRECQSYSDEAGTAGHSSAREIVAQRVHGGRLGDARSAHRRVQVALQALLVDMVAMQRLAARVPADGVGRKDPEPGPAFGGAAVLGGQRIGQVDAGLGAVVVSLPDAARLAQLQAQGAVEGTRQHDDTVLAALAVAHDDHLAHEVDVFDAQADALEQAHAGAVEQAAEQACDTALAHAREQRLHFDMREHDGDALLRHRAAELAQPRHVDADHLAVEKEQRAQRLAMRRRRDAALVGEHDEKVLHLRRPELARMTAARPAHEASHPIDIGFLGA